jgi:hypothetical protein
VKPAIAAFEWIEHFFKPLMLVCSPIIKHIGNNIEFRKMGSTHGKLGVRAGFLTSSVLFIGSGTINTALAAIMNKSLCITDP